MKRWNWMNLVLAVILLAILWETLNQSEQEEASKHPEPKETLNPNLSESGHGYQDSHPLVAKVTHAKPPHHEEQERLENWKRNFPFKPRYHPTLRHNPTIFDANNASTWDAPDDPEASIKHESYRRTVVNHGFLMAFHDNPARYTKEFEQLYHVLGEFNRNENSIVVAEIFNDLITYHEASRHHPEDLITKTMPIYNEEKGSVEIQHVPVNGKTTWGDYKSCAREGIAFSLFQESEWPSKPQMTAERAWELADYIISAISAEGFESLSFENQFAFSIDHQEALNPGDQLLIPKEGYVEAYEEYVRKTHRPVLVNSSEGMPEVLVLGEDGRFYDKATGELFMPGMEPIIVEPGQKPQFR
jgi:hypothetical protein